MAAGQEVVGVGGTGYLSGIASVTAGYAHTCALTTGGNVYCWGNNQYGQLGNNATVQTNSPIQVVSVSGTGVLGNVTSISAGAYHTCAVAGGEVYCWGQNTSGQLGNNSLASSSIPVGTLNAGLVGLTGITSVTTGQLHSCAVSTATGIYCWGGNTAGQLGLNSLTSQTTAQPVVGVGGAGYLSGISTVSAGAGGNYTCALPTSGTGIYCWGQNTSGQLGNSTTTSSLTPVSSVVANGLAYLALW